MQMINWPLLFLSLIFFHLPLSALFGEEREKKYLLPTHHPLQKKLKKLFKDPDMFDSPDHLRRSGFQVFERVHRGLMVASHPSIKNYLFKKFKNKIVQKEQLNNYVRRITGARALHDFINKNHLQHIVVPNKWLYPLPKEFSDPTTKEKTYILVVEKMDLCGGEKDSHGEIAQKYGAIDRETLRELCLVVYQFRGLDSMLHNMPFTYQNKIAFIDTERWQRKREGFLSQVLPYLSEERKADAKGIFEELQNQELIYIL